jgi:ferredoxin
MKISKTNLIYYSPTGNSKKIIEGVAKGLGVKDTKNVDLTHPEASSKSIDIPPDTLAVIAVPVYSGRVPPVAAQRLRNVKGNGSPAVVIAVYGNRAYEDALIELRDIATEQGFKVISAAAFVGEHSFSTEVAPIAQGRPDAEDLEKAKSFGGQVKAKLDGAASPVEVAVPGNRPYRERNPSIPRVPETSPDACTLCGACEEACPTKAIKVTDKVETTKDSCTACSACIKACPTGARAWNNEGIKKAQTMLTTQYSKRREPEFFT